MPGSGTRHPTSGSSLRAGRSDARHAVPLAVNRFKIELSAFLVAATVVSGLIYWRGSHAPLDDPCPGSNPSFIQYKRRAPIRWEDWPSVWDGRIKILLAGRMLSVLIIGFGVFRRWSRPVLLSWCWFAALWLWFGFNSAIAPQIRCAVFIDDN